MCLAYSSVQEHALSECVMISELTLGPETHGDSGACPGVGGGGVVGGRVRVWGHTGARPQFRDTWWLGSMPQIQAYVMAREPFWGPGMRCGLGAYHAGVETCFIQWVDRDLVKAAFVKVV
jgi:hypothetical protein